ncbi:hypothetical protein IV102_33715 [bacterium]|nr:hypothetical protein [bacterium]
MQSNSLPPPVTPRVLDVYTRVAFFTQLPDYQSDLSGYRSLPSALGGGCGLHWNFATPSGPVYDEALPSYLAQVMQSQTPLGSGGARREAPSRPQEGAKAPVSPVSATRARQRLPEVLDFSESPEAAAQSLAVRLTGEARRRAALTMWQPRPEENHDSLHWERLALYFVLARDSSLRYNVDSGRFLRVYCDGESRDVLSMAWVGQVLRQGQPDRWNRVEQRISLLPLDQHLFTPPPPPPPKPAPRPRVVAPSPVVVVPPGPVAASPGPVAAASKPTAAVPVPAVGAPVPPVAAAPVVALPGPGEPAVVAASPPAPVVPTTGFSLKVHRYWDIAAGGYSAILAVRLEGDGQDESVENCEGKPYLIVTRELPLGSHWRITVSWANGATRCWEQALSHPRGCESEVFSPDG